MSTRTAPKDRALIRYRWIAVWLPLAVMIVVAVVQASVIDDLTATVAVHFDWNGTADGWGPGWTWPVMTLAVGVIFAVVFGLIGLLGFRGFEATERPMRLRPMATVSAVVSGFLAVTLGSGAMEGSAGGMGFLWSMVVGAVVAAVVGVLAYRFGLDVEGTRPAADTPTPAAMSGDERAVWMGRCTLVKGGAWLVIGFAVFCVLLTVLAAWVEIDESGSIGWMTWFALVCTALAASAIPATTSVLIRVDATGFTARSPMGWPIKHIALDQVERTEVVDVDPMADFGGWGWRKSMVGGDHAVCLRAGEGMRIAYTGGKLFTATVDDAATAAALLEGLKARA